MKQETKDLIEKTNSDIDKQIDALVKEDLKEYGRVKLKTRYLIEELEEQYII